MADRQSVFTALDDIHEMMPISCIIEGGASGADRHARQWAAEHDVPWDEYVADWIKYGKGAGPIRNAQMIAGGKPDHVVAFIATPPTPGTANMVRQAKKAGLPVSEFTI